MHIKALKRVLGHELILEKVQRVIEFNQQAQLKLDINMNTELKTNSKNDLEKDFLKLMNNFCSEKILKKKYAERHETCDN